MNGYVDATEATQLIGCTHADLLTWATPHALIDNYGQTWIPRSALPHLEQRRHRTHISLPTAAAATARTHLAIRTACARGRVRYDIDTHGQYWIDRRDLHKLHLDYIPPPDPTPRGGFPKPPPLAHVRALLHQGYTPETIHHLTTTPPHNPTALGDDG